MMHLVGTTLVLILVLTTETQLTTAQLAEGDRCTPTGGGTGVCRSLPSCPAAQQALKRGQSPVVCGFEGFQSVVCCPGANAGSTLSAVTTARPNRRATTRRPGTPTFTHTGDPNSKSEQMCREYAKSVFVLERPPVLGTDDNEWVNRSVCAIIETPLVVGGEEAKLKEFPHMALLGYGLMDNPSWFCGGSLISDFFVITAAHCLSSREEGPVKLVRLGELQISNSNDGSETQNIAVTERIAHPDYKLPGRYNDIALLRLEKKVQFNAFVRPACLHRTKELPGAVEQIKFIATGWGRVGYSDSTSDVLLKVGLTPIPHESCNRTYRTEASSSKLRRGIDDDSMLCAGEKQGGKDTCQGDSGGPLQYVRRDPYCMYNVIGITSFGKFCGFSNSPAVYTRIANYMSWIENIVWP